MLGKSSWDQANIRQNMVWFGEKERKLAKLSKTTSVVEPEPELEL